MIFLPSSQVLPYLPSFLAPPSLPLFFHQVDPWGSRDGASLAEVTDKGKGGGRWGRQRGRRKGAVVLTPAFCPDEGPEDRQRQAPG